MLSPAGLRELLDAFDLGDGVLSPAPMARGRVGEIWRLDTSSGAWAVKVDPNEVSEAGVSPSAAFQELAAAAGTPAPALRRTRDGRVLAQAGGRAFRVLEWVDMAPADPAMDPSAVGRVVAALHRLTPVDGRWTGTDVDPWFTAPVGAAAWDALVAEVGRRDAPFAPAFAAHRDELVALEALLEPPTHLQWCHHDLFADNIRSRLSGGLVVFDFDNSGPENASRELAMVVTEFATGEDGADAGRVRDLMGAYEEAGGPGRLTRAADFGLVIAVLGHVAEHAARRWLAATDDETRDDMASWAVEIVTRPLNRAVIADILDTSSRTSRTA